MVEVKGLGLRWLCPDCGRILQLDRAPTAVKDPTTKQVRRYHSSHCQSPLVRCTVELGDGPHADRLEDALEKAESIEPVGSPEWVESGIAMRTTVLREIREAMRS